MSNTLFRNVGWTIGSHCNAHCAHCYSREQRKHQPRGLHEQELERVIAQLVALGVCSVNLGGNEPIFTHGPQLQDSRLPWLLQRLHRAGLAVGLTTNGASFHALHDHHPGALSTLNDIDFSLDFPTQRRHDQHRGAALFSSVIRALQRCRELGIPCAIVTCATRESFTAETIDGFMDLAWLLGCELRVNTLQPVQPALLANMPSRDAFFEGFARLMRHSDCISLGDACLAAVVDLPATGCPCGHSSFRVQGRSADGCVPLSPCVYSHDFRTGDLLEDPAQAIVQSEPFTRFGARRRRVPRACQEADCPWLEACRGGCASRAWLVHGSLETKDPYCPLDYQRDHGRPPALPTPLSIAQTAGQRVHDGYLCTWIGRPRPDYQPTRSDLEHFLEG